MNESSSPFVVSARSSRFRARFYPAASTDEWNDWRWQSRHRLRGAAQLARIVTLSDDERGALRAGRDTLPLGITPYYASLLAADEPAQPLRRTVIPVGAEGLRSPGEADDPLAEVAHSPVPAVVHRYPDRALLLVTSLCTTYCRYCTRSRMVGGSGELAIERAQIEQGLAYIAATPRIRDVLISGGDPLSLGDDKLQWVLQRLRAISHVEFIRLGTKVPLVMPQRITASLVQVLRGERPVWLSLHVTHPDELTPEVVQACGRLADGGLPLGSQTVLLKGINDDLPTMRTLMHGLLKIRVKPYYLLQCDPVSGSGHFRTSIAKGLELIRGLRGHTTGYAVPHYIIDAPAGGGKISLVPEHVVGRDGDNLLFLNYEGNLYRYPDPDGNADKTGEAPWPGETPGAERFLI